MRAIVISRHGGPEVLELHDIPVPEPGPGEALVRVHVAGVNFADVYYRIGRYAQQPPFSPGLEGAGVVERVGPGVTDVHAGERVAWAMHLGSYAEFAIVPAWKLVPVPPGIDDRVAAAAMVQGLTAEFLTHTTYPVQPGDDVLVHAAAGGVGLLLVQMARQRGARVIGTTSTEAKAALAREAGADEVILYTRVDFRDEARRLTNREGVAVVYDGVGKDTFERSLDSLRPRGYLVLFGAASGPVPPFDPQQLAAKGSLFLTRPSLAAYMRTRAELLDRARVVFDMLEAGTLRIRAPQPYALDNVAQAQRDLEGRRTTGKIVLDVAPGT